MGLAVEIVPILHRKGVPDALVLVCGCNPNIYFVFVSFLLLLLLSFGNAQMELSVQKFVFHY